MSSISAFVMRVPIGGISAFFLFVKLQVLPFVDSAFVFLAGDFLEKVITDYR